MNRKLSIPLSIADQIRAHAESAYPEECIGGVLGSIGPDQGRVVQGIHRLENASAGNRRRRALVLPEEYLRVDRIARESNLEILGWYHSHPDVAAIPSAYDLAHAFPWYSYLIVRVRQGNSAELRSWQLKEDRSGFNEEIIDTKQLVSLNHEE